MISLDDLYVNAADLVEGVVFNYEEGIFLDDHLQQLSHEQIVAEVMQSIERSDGYRYTVTRIGNPQLRSIINFGASCCQRPERQNQSNDDERRRLRLRMTTHDCEGSVVGNIDKNQRWINIRVNHKNHPQPIQQYDATVSNELKDFIRQRTLTTTCAELYHLACDRFGLGTTRAQVYYWRKETIKPLYRYHENQMQSTRLLVQQRTNLGFEECQILFSPHQTM
ncbi:unnamed protein product [Absidia cylindrospora]